MVRSLGKTLNGTNRFGHTRPRPLLSNKLETTRRSGTALALRSPSIFSVRPFFRYRNALTILIHNHCLKYAPRHVSRLLSEGDTSSLECRCRFQQIVRYRIENHLR